MSTVTSQVKMYNTCTVQIYTLTVQMRLYAHMRMVICTHVLNAHKHIYAFTWASDVSLLFRTKSFLCVSLL